MSLPRRLPPRAPLVTLGIVVLLAAGFLLANGPGTPFSSAGPSSSSVASVPSATAATGATVSTSPGASVPRDPTAAPAATSAPPTPAPTALPTARPGLDGTWIGTWRVASPEALVGELVIAFVEAAGSIEGQVTTGDQTCLDAGALVGTAAGNDVAFTVRQRELFMSFVGTRSGATISGTFQATGCTYTEGTWQVTRQ